MDLTTAKVLLAREAGYIRTSVACAKLNVNATELLRLRRQMILSALSVKSLPGLVAAKDEPSTNPKPEGRTKAC